MDNSIRVSIVLPTYNGKQYLRQSIESCLNQTYKDIQLIIVDDASTDETSEIIRSYSDTRIRYIRNKINQGLPRSLNIGFRQAEGDYLTWSSDDNFYTVDAIEKMLNFLRHKKSDFVYSDFYYFEEENKDSAIRVKLDPMASLTKENCIRACFLYSRKVWHDIGEFDPEVELAEDYDYWIRISKRFSMSHYDKPLYFYRGHNNSLSRVRTNEVMAVTTLLRLKYDFINILEARKLVEEIIMQRFLKFYKINVFVLKYFVSPKINAAFKNFKDGNISFAQTKQIIYSLANSRLITVYSA